MGLWFLLVKMACYGGINNITYDIQIKINKINKDRGIVWLMLNH
jgi:hypothetical protein